MTGYITAKQRQMVGLTENKAKTKENTKAKRRKRQQRRLRSNHHVAEAEAKGTEISKARRGKNFKESST